MKITQRSFVEQFAVRCGITETAAANYIDSFKRLVYQLVAEGNTVELSGFGKFEISHRATRTGINPRTLQPMTIPELNTVKFRAGEAFKSAVTLKPSGQNK